MTTCVRKTALLPALCLFLSLGSVSLFAQISKTDFSNVSDLALNGSAHQADNVLRLTQAGSFHSNGTAWFNTQQSVANGFTSVFVFRINGGATPADGISFVIQNSSGDGFGTAALGGSGGAIGYGVPDPYSDTGTPIPNALAVELDTYQNPWDPDANHIAVQSCGPDPITQHHDATCPSGQAAQLGIAPGLPISLADGNQHTLVVDYDPGTLRVFLDDLGSPVLTVTVNLSTLLTLGEGGVAWVGFSSGTGAQTETSDILSWTFTPGDQSTQITQELTAGSNQPVDTNFVFGSYNHKPEYTGAQSGDQVTVTATPIDQQTFHDHRLVGTPFADAQCVIYDGTGGKCVLFSVTCNGSTDCTDLEYTLFNNFNTSQQIHGAGLLKTDPIGSNNWQNIIESFTQGRNDPGSNSKTKGFSDFIMVQGATSAPTFQNVSPAKDSTVPVNTPVQITFNCVTDSTAPGVTLVPGDDGCKGLLDGAPISNNSFVTFTQLGTHSLALSSGDSVLNTSSLSANFTVGQSPSFTSGNAATFTVGSMGSFTVMTTGSPAAAITETGLLPSGLSLLSNGDGTATLSGIPGAGTGGIYNITLQANNSAGSAMQAFTINVNQAPAFTSANNATFTAGVFGSFTVTTTGFPTVALSRSGTLPGGVNFVDNGNGTATLSGTPSMSGTFTPVFTATNVAGSVQQNFTLQVSGPIATLSPSSINFGTVYLYTLLYKNVTLTNGGSSNLSISKVSVALGNADADDFPITNHCSSTLGPGKSCIITVFFWADDVGTRTATLKVADNAPNSPQQVSLTGTVIRKGR